MMPGARRHAAIEAYRKNSQANHPTNAKAAIVVTIAATVTTLSQTGPIGHDGYERHPAAIGPWTYG